MSEEYNGWKLDGDMNAMNLDVVSPLGRIAMIDCENDELTDAQLMANAALIAAAPDMLEALEWAVEAADANQYEACWYAAARSAISKAKGAE